MAVIREFKITQMEGLLQIREYVVFLPIQVHSRTRTITIVAPVKPALSRRVVIPGAQPRTGYVSVFSTRTTEYHHLTRPEPLFQIFIKTHYIVAIAPLISPPSSTARVQ